MTNKAIGNALFIYYILTTVAKKTGFTPVYPIGKDYTEKSNGQRYQQLNTGFYIPIKQQKISALQDQISHQFKEKKDNIFDPSIFDIKDGTNISGYFQNLSYYKEGMQLAFQTEVLSHAYYIFNKFEINSENCVGVHIRRGDYLKVDRHPVLPMEYYGKAMSHFDNHQFLVISDDYEWVKNNFNYKNCHIIPSNKNAFIDLCAFSLCAHQIIANSSFSWWGASLNKNIDKKVVAPDNWSKGRKMNIVPQEWIKL